MADNQEISTVDKDANCRLRYCLNSYCLSKIFRCLQQNDLFTLIQMNKYYKELILENVISTIELRLTDNINENRTLMEQFGVRLKRIRFNVDNDA